MRTGASRSATKSRRGPWRPLGTPRARNIRPATARRGRGSVRRVSRVVGLGSSSWRSPARPGTLPSSSPAITAFPLACGPVRSGRGLAAVRARTLFGGAFTGSARALWGIAPLARWMPAALRASPCGLAVLFVPAPSVAARLDLLVETGEVFRPVDDLVVVGGRVHLLCRWHFLRHVEVDIGFFPFLVARQHIAHGIYREPGHGRRFPGFLENVPHHLREDVGLDVDACSASGLQLGIRRGIALDRLDVHVQLVVQAALQLAALPCELLRVERQLLVACSTGGDSAQVGEPRAAAELTPAGADAAHTARLLARPDLLHVYPRPEAVRQFPQQIPEIDALLGRIVERGPAAIALELHVAHLHVQTRLLADAAGLHQRSILALACGMPRVNVLLR